MAVKMFSSRLNQTIPIIRVRKRTRINNNQTISRRTMLTRARMVMEEAERAKEKEERMESGNRF
jgi:hypothetical protein